MTVKVWLLNQALLTKKRGKRDPSQKLWTAGISKLVVDVGSLDGASVSLTTVHVAVRKGEDTNIKLDSLNRRVDGRIHKQTYSCTS